jgi:hypothetical protein
MRAGVKLAAALCLLAGCVPNLAVPPHATNKAELRRTLGRPTDIRFGPHGEEIWEFARGPLGRQTFIARIAPGGTVVGIWQVLSREFYDRIIPYRSTAADVRALLGRPADVQFYSASGTEVWEYPITDEAARDAKLTVKFDDNNVVLEVGKLVETPGANISAPHGARTDGTGGHK